MGMVICALSSNFNGIGYGKSSTWLQPMSDHFQSFKHGHAEQKDVLKAVTLTNWPRIHIPVLVPHGKLVAYKSYILLFKIFKLC